MRADEADDAALAELRGARRAELLPLHLQAYRESYRALATARIAIDALAEVEDQPNAIGGDVGPEQLAVG